MDSSVRIAARSRYSNGKDAALKVTNRKQFGRQSRTIEWLMALCLQREIQKSKCCLFVRDGCYIIEMEGAYSGRIT